MSKTIRLTKVLEIDSSTGDLFLKKIHQSAFNTLNYEMQQDGFENWYELKERSVRSRVEIENLITEKANKLVQKGVGNNYIPQLKDTLNDVQFVTDSIRIEVVSIKKDDGNSCKLRCYFTTRKLTLLDTFGTFLIIGISNDLDKHLTCTIELEQGISITAYE